MKFLKKWWKKWREKWNNYWDKQREEYKTSEVFDFWNYFNNPWL